jgi:hypothetical protein
MARVRVWIKEGADLDDVEAVEGLITHKCIQASSVREVAGRYRAVCAAAAASRRCSLKNCCNAPPAPHTLNSIHLPRPPPDQERPPSRSTCTVSSCHRRPRGACPTAPRATLRRRPTWSTSRRRAGPPWPAVAAKPAAAAATAAPGREMTAGAAGRRFPPFWRRTTCRALRMWWEGAVRV